MGVTGTFAKLALILAAVMSFSLSDGVGQATSIPETRQISIEELVKSLQSPEKDGALIIQVGSHVLYSQAHIPGSEYVGPASSDAGIQRLRKRVESLPRTKLIVLYCGCCPWNHCPNVKPAYEALEALGFRNFKVLYLANNFGADWVGRGYPTAKGD